MRLAKLLATMLLAFTCLSLLLIWFHPSTNDFNPDNVLWNGSKEFIRCFNARVLRSLGELPDEPDGLALVEVPYRPFEPWELEELTDFLRDGGTVLLMDDCGHGNQVLEELGLATRFARAPLLDPLFNYKNKWFPRVSDFSRRYLPEHVEAVVLNHATALVNTSDVHVLARSSSFSFLDLDGDGFWGSGEPMGPLPVAACARVGDGLLVLVSDPSIIINSMLYIADNKEFVSELASLKGANKVLFDASHLPRTSLDRAKEVLRQVRDLVASPYVAPAVVVIMLAALMRPVWSRARSHGA